MRTGRLLLVAILIIMGGQLTACSAGGDFVSLPPAEGTYPIETSLREFYQALDGEELLGPGISEALRADTLTCQFTPKTLLCMDTTAPETERFFLFPLGEKLGVRDEPLKNATASEGGLMVDGYEIYKDFLPLYDQLHGARYTGKPITQLRIDSEKDRVMQFFENVGFYKDRSDPTGTIHLMDYGAWLCDAACRYQAVDVFSPKNQPDIRQPFAISIDRINNGEDIIGAPMTQPFTGTDGEEEQVYTNAAFHAPYNHHELVRLRPLPLLLGQPTTPPQPKIDDPQIIFYPVAGELGYNVPRFFDDLITMHGGMEISGRPISEVVEMPDLRVFRQCFENYCLDYDPSASEDQRIHLAPLGLQYLETAATEQAEIVQFIFSPESVRLQLSAAKEQVTADEEQTFLINVVKSSDLSPISQVKSVLTVEFTDGSQQTFYPPATGSDGAASITIPPQPDQVNGRMVAYQVCLNVPSLAPICVPGTYLIWNSQ